MMNQELSTVLKHMAEILEFGGDPKDRYRVRAYQRAALAILQLPEGLEKMAAEKRLREIPGVGEGIAKKIEEYLSTRKIKEYEMMKKTVPKGLFELLLIPSLGPKKVRRLFEELAVADVPSLKKAITKGHVQKLDGFGEKSARKILEGVEMKAKSKGRQLIGEVYLTVQAILQALEAFPGVQKAVAAGSFRRCEETVGDIDILATGIEKTKIINFFCGQPFSATLVAAGKTKATILTPDGLQVDLRVVSPVEFGSALQYFTGSKSHNVHLRTFAKNRGFKLSEYGFFKGEKRVASRNEEDCYASLGMQYIPPEIRLDTGEIEAAFRHELPRLIELSDIRGDLHAHSRWSDGNHSIRQMAEEAHRHGYEYLAMTDHSPSLRVAHGLTLDRLKQKKKEIDGLALPLRVLFGTEVDILPSGKIDYPDDVLKEFDIVVASVHSRLGQDATERILKALEHPSVQIIGHPSGRLIGQRKPSPLQYEKIFKKAAETGTVMEINAHYERLDLADEKIREAKRWKCRFAINSDAHSIAGLWMMELGVRYARRGWVTKEDVVNTQPLKKLMTSLK